MTVLSKTKLYDTDFYAWTQHQVDRLRAEAFEEVDWDNLIEEIAAMGAAQRRELTSRLQVLIMHLLKWQYQPDLRSKSWSYTIRDQRNELAYLLEESPSLHTLLPERIARAYPRAVKNALEETGFLHSPFPTTCAYTAAQILDESFWPEG
jgi:anaerobic selenocysteine-containing dehydrogenase